MGLDNLFKLAKLTIEAYQDVGRKQPIPPPQSFEVQYNPASLSLRHETVFHSMQGEGTSSAQATFSHSRSRRLSVTLELDGTHVGYFGVELLSTSVPTVADRIKQFLSVCYQFQGEIHEPAYLRLLWGKGVLEPNFDCRLESVDITYTAFDRDGSPLHAELKAAFVEDLDPEKKAKLDRAESPDLSHRRVVVSGDTLPLLCRSVYGSAEHYLRVAEVNGLDDFRELTPGQELIFPPFARRGNG